ncbi:tRNA wybutosine-synthesizing protein 2 [Gaeumannomyces tritici R3-111a-1]|uniref:tRNA wybutosine-synthesizing protein 2 n=1 Tax=Gaeumannomyces tritici (strain R3-111a-1) TaxID=644352 RepID=J3NSY1_GAET3|nr:tRNA wybutosine-synthesizing protein 2 [Gaeumannomyces tritici R3-111a-1]EJT79294.1 tRNA wybutosine-synthesizing protein 2 [Gaeumannomyces tritici R3-111a-1]
MAQQDDERATTQRQDATPRPPKKPRAKKPKAENPITAAVTEWLATTSHSSSSSLDDDPTRQLLLDSAPKRWVVYEPMVLLPSGSFASDAWRAALAGSGAADASRLWAAVLAALSARSPTTPLTHLAVNEGIPPLSAGGRGGENVLRSPSGLRILHGDFGPAAVVVDDDEGVVSDDNFDRAFWVSTRQNDICQTWAPRWTMFSRGNVKEKARLLGLVTTTRNGWAADLYAGIGYFTFSYVRLGLRVLAWELNPWSVEGLRRGAARNGWRVRVVRGAADLARHTAELVGEGEGDEGGVRIVVFQESNEQAARRVAELREAEAEAAVELHHINCGFLPSSAPSWRAALDMAAGNGRGGGDCWLHLHENVGVAQIGARAAEVQELLAGWAADRDGEIATVEVEHTEMVKTFAPDVWHCVFDVRVGR